MSFREELLHVLRCGSARARLKQSATRKQGNDRQHFRTCAELEYREQVGQVVA